MFRNPVAVAAPSRTRPAARSRLVRAGFALAILTSLTAFTVRAEAQTASEHRAVELRPFVGAFVPTGDHRDVLKGAALVGAQVAYSFTPNVALAGTFGWAPSKDKLALASTKLDLFQYDLGIEGRLSDLTPSAAVLTRPYAALGVGGRTYRYRDLKSADSQTNVLGYGAIGLDVVQARGPVGVRLEARDNVTSFKGLDGALTERKARNDVQFSAGLTFRI
jgi:hypothetical protein